VIQEFS